MSRGRNVDTARARGHAEFVGEGIPAADEDAVAEGMGVSGGRIAGGQPVAGKETTAVEVGAVGNQGAGAIVVARTLWVGGGGVLPPPEELMSPATLMKLEASSRPAGRSRRRFAI